MTSAAPGDGEEVRTTARMPDGTEVQGEAWFRVDARPAGSSGGPRDRASTPAASRCGAAGDGSEVEVHLHTTRVEDGDAEVQQGIDETLGRIRTRREALSAS